MTRPDAREDARRDCGSHACAMSVGWTACWSCARPATRMASSGAGTATPHAASTSSCPAVAGRATRPRGINRQILLAVCGGVEVWTRRPSSTLLVRGRLCSRFPGLSCASLRVHSSPARTRSTTSLSIACVAVRRASRPSPSLAPAVPGHLARAPRSCTCAPVCRQRNSWRWPRRPSTSAKRRRHDGSVRRFSRPSQRAQGARVPHRDWSSR